MTQRDVRAVSVLPTASIRDAIQVIDRGAMAIALVVDDRSGVLGTVTDGDVRRGMLRGLGLDASVEQVMHRHPVTALQGSSQEALLLLMRQHQVEHVPITDETGRVVGLELLSDFLEPHKEKNNQVVVFAGGAGTCISDIYFDVIDICN